MDSVRRSKQRARRASCPSRNRELLNLIVVGVLTGVGFASVYIARQEQISDRVALLRGVLPRRSTSLAHLVARLTVPYADPYLLPMAGLLTAIGLTEIYRLEPDDAFRQGLLVVSASPSSRSRSSCCATTTACSSPTSTSSGSARSRCWCCPRCRSSARRSTAHASGSTLGPLQFQPGELAKICLIVFLAGYLREKREVLTQGRLKDFGPLLVIWGGAMLVLVETNDLGSALLYFGIFLAMLYVATGRLLYVGSGLGLFVAGAAAAYQLDPAGRRSA